MKQVKKMLLLFTLILPYTLSNAQYKKIELSEVNTIAQAEEFKISHPQYEADVFSIIPGEERFSKISPDIFYKKIGYIFNMDNYTYKLVGIDSVLSFRVSYIFLDGNKYTKTEIEKTRPEIIKKYRSGVKFTNLVSKYNMDGNKTGDTNWFTEKMMVAEFENAVKAHKKDDIFTVDTPSQNWYHVVLKTYNDKHVKKLTILKVKRNS